MTEERHALRRLVATLAIVLTAAWVVAGCQADLEGLDPRGEELVFWCHHNPTLGAALDSMVTEFNRVNQHGIEVRAQSLGSYADVYDRMRVAVQTDQLPDLIVAYGNQARDFHASGDVVDLTAYMQSPRWGLSAHERDDYVAELLAMDHSEGVQVALRPNFSTELLYYNADWLAELGYDGPPTSWEAFASACRDASAQAFSHATWSGRPLGYVLEEDASRIASMVFSRGGGLMNAWRRAYTFHTEPMAQSLSMVRALGEYGALRVATSDRATEWFAAGGVLFLTRSSSQLSAVAAAAGDFA